MTISCEPFPILRHRYFYEAHQIVVNILPLVIILHADLKFNGLVVLQRCPVQLTHKYPFIKPVGFHMMHHPISDFYG